MRKENATRLLLSLLTAFVMVAGVFGAAVETFSSNLTDESGVPMVIEEADSEPELEAGGIGDAPISAQESIDLAFADTLSDQTQLGPGAAPMDAVNPDLEDREEDREEDPYEEVPLAENIEAQSTRSPDTVDANGPYGQGIPVFDPEWEGLPLTFDATIDPIDEHDNYRFRWDANGDGIYDGPGDPGAPDYSFGEYGESELPYTFGDDFKGEALVEAWDETWTWTTVDGDCMNEPDFDSHWWWPPYYSMTWGWTFEVTKPAQIDQFGYHRSSYGYPYRYYNIRIWENSALKTSMNNPPTPGYGSWRWRSLSTPVDLIPGNTYTISAYINSYYGEMPMINGPVVDPNGIIDPSDRGVYTNTNTRPTMELSSTVFPMIDFHYKCTYQTPNVLSDTADVLVWNQDPDVYDARVEPIYSDEGAAGANYKATLWDFGKDDDWWFQWFWGDGTYSDWMPVPKASGGIKALWVHTYSGQMPAIMDDFAAELGINLVQQDEYDCGPLGSNSAPDLSLLEQYDVVLIGSNYIPAAGVGDVLYEYCKGGGGVVELVAMFHPTFGVGGDWRSEGYSVYPVTATVSSGSSLTIYDDTHPIIDGIAGKVSSYGCSLCIGVASITPGAVLLADYNTGWKAAAYRNEDEREPGSGRVVGLDIFAQPGYHSGDAFMAIANAAFWASQQEPAVLLELPFDLPEVSHVYPDDHPEHTTPSDEFQPSVRVKDDDHCVDRILGKPLIYDQNFDSGWGIYGNNPPPDWKIIDDGYLPKVWDYNDWHRYYFSTGYPGGTGTYAARVYYYPIEQQDEELITPSIDVAGYSSVTLKFVHYYNDYTTARVDYGDVDVAFDGGSWTTVRTYSQSDDSGTETIAITVPSGADTMQIRWRYRARQEYYWFVDNVEVLYGTTSIFDEDFNGAWGTYGNNPPPGWTIIDNGVSAGVWDYNDWHRYMYYSSYPGPGTQTQAARCYYYPYERGDEWLISPEFDLTTGSYSTANFQFRTYWYNPYPNNRASINYRLNGGSWTELARYSTTQSGDRIFFIPDAIGNKVEIGFNYLSPQATYQGYCFWYVENFHFEAIPALKHVYGMSAWAETTDELTGDPQPVTVRNVFPTALGMENVAKEVNEDDVITFEGLEITDPALWEDTEEFWYRMIWDDGTQTPWVYKGAMSKMSVLLIHSMSTSGHGGADFPPIRDAILSNPYVTQLDYYNPFDSQDTPDLATLEQYGVIVLATNWANTLGWWAAAMKKLGDNLVDYLDHNSGGFVSLMFTLDLSIYYGDLFGLPGNCRYVMYDYGAFEPETYPFTPGTLGTIYEPDHPVMQGVTDVSCLYVQSGDYRTTVGGLGNAAGRNGLLLADWSTGNSAFGVKELQNGARSVNLGLFANAAGDYNQLVANAITWSVGGNIVDPYIPAMTHTYGDNGKYYADLQLLDDDMNWAWKPGDAEPTYVGPEGEEDKWISHNIMEVEVLNTDPVISSVEVYAEVDLGLRVSGTKNTDCKMTLFSHGPGGTEEVSVTVTRDPGSPDVGFLGNQKIHMTKDHSYEVLLECTGGTGGNPTWIFDMSFPDGKFKEFKHTFNDEHGWSWLITNAMLKGAMVGHDLIFDVHADDAGSDDLAFIYNYGDTTPHGVHLYANIAQDDPIEGYTQDAELMFTQLGDDADPWFEYDPNDERSPDLNQIHVTDSISHIFSDAYYYYCCIVVNDDDIGEPYPSTELHLQSGCDMANVEVDLTGL